MPDVKELTTPIPPLEEQEQIVAFVVRERSKLNNLINRVSDAISCLQEYRAALISAAVMGKIDVRSEALVEQSVGRSS